MKKLATLAFVVLLAACGSKDAGKFEGQWTEIRRGSGNVDIKKEGSSYIVRVSNPNNRRNPGPGAPLTATVQDGKLVLETLNGKPSFTYNKETDTLLFVSGIGNEEYRRLK